MKYKTRRVRVIFKEQNKPAGEEAPPNKTQCEHEFEDAGSMPTRVIFCTKCGKTLLDEDTSCSD